MAEESFVITSSQEGPQESLSLSQQSCPSSQQSPPLSQELFEQLWNQLPLGYRVQNPESAIEQCLPPNLQVLNNPGLSLPSNASSSIPASQNWPGVHGFMVSFPPQKKVTKGVSWTYSEIKDKLYVGKDVSCPVNFIVSNTVPSDVILRALAMYSAPEHASEAVNRCMDHSVEEMQRGVNEANHLIRCESKGAKYMVDLNSKRHCVVVPFENPPVGQQFSTYIYRFTCFNSCTGGPNRRPLMVVFTLERGDEVIGRHKLDVKICACPGRDQKLEEGDQNKEGKPIRSKKKAISENDVPEHSKGVPLTPAIASTSREGQYAVTAENRELYEFLRNMKSFFEYSKTVTKKLPSNVRRAVLQYANK